MDHFPIFIDIRGRSAVVVGGGPVAARKVELLRRAQADVTVVAPTLCAALKDLAHEGAIAHRGREFEAGDLDGARLVVAATDDGEVNAAVAAAAEARGLPVNVADAPALCSFILPSIIDRSPVVVAISTGGAAPVLARNLRGELEAAIPASYGTLATLLRRHRGAIRAAFPDLGARRRFFESILDGTVAELVFSGRAADAEAELLAALEAGRPSTIEGEVYLVGAGPGDPDLLTLRALRLMQRADVVLYDRLVSPAILDRVRREAERIYVGKRRDYHALRQDEINRVLVELARKGQRVLRLKGGDPFIFGRGGEEIATLAQEGIRFEVVPGITAANGCAAYAGIPLTHRDYAQSVLLVTGHRRDGGRDLDWDALTRPFQTLVVYMGLLALPGLCEGLVRHGMSTETPAALVEQGTTERQRVFTGTLATLPASVAAEEVHAPTLLIVGDVVRLRDRLAWGD